MFVSCKTRHNKDGSWWAIAREQNNHASAGGMGVGSDEDEAVEKAVDSLKKICGVSEESVVRLPLGSESNREMSESDVSLFESFVSEDEDDLEDIDGSVAAESLDDDDGDDDGDDGISQFGSCELVDELIGRLRDMRTDDMDDWFSPSSMRSLTWLKKRLNELL